MSSRSVCLRVCPILLVVSCAYSQADVLDKREQLHVAPPSDRFPAKWYPQVSGEVEVSPAPVTDHPYTAASGPVPSGVSVIPKSRNLGFQARDRFGRTRTEAESGGMSYGGNDVKIKTVLVSDPVSHCDFHWMQPVSDIEMPSKNRIAFVTCRSQILRYQEFDWLSTVMATVPEGISQNGDTISKVEHLASLSRNGYTISRFRDTNSQLDDKGHTIISISETWYSPELRELIRFGDEQTGYIGLTNIQLVDPDPRLFFPPDGYRIDIQPAR